jgi:hypothetical protein
MSMIISPFWLFKQLTVIFADDKLTTWSGLSVGMLVDEMRFAVGYVSPVCLLFYSNFVRISLL